MCMPTEIIILFFIISFLVYTMPMVLVKFSKTNKGRFLLLLLTIVITLYNRTGGLLMAMLIIFLSEFNYEVNNDIIYEGFDATEQGQAPDKKEKKAEPILTTPSSTTTTTSTETIPGTASKGTASKGTAT
jgi:hypothetical protein